LDDAARAALSHALLAAVGPTTAKALRAAGLEPEVVAARPGVRELARAIEQHLAAHPERLEILRARQDQATSAPAAGPNDRGEEA
jgi:uroporphyrinogen-III synthase